MKKWTIAIFAALLAAAWASAQQADSQLLPPEPVQAVQQTQPETPGLYTETAGALAGLIWQAAYTAPDGTTGALHSGLARAVSIVDQTADQMADPAASVPADSGDAQSGLPLDAQLAAAGVWDLLPSGSTVTLTIPGQADAVTAVWIPASEDAQAAAALVPAQQVTVTPGTDGTLTWLTCTLPVAFTAADGTAADKLYGVVTVTRPDGTQQEFGFALADAA